VSSCLLCSALAQTARRRKKRRPARNETQTNPPPKPTNFTKPTTQTSPKQTITTQPLGLGKDPAALKWFQQSEIIHARTAMTGVAGILIPSGLNKLGVTSLPEWWEAGKVQSDNLGISLNALIATHFALIHFVEVKRWQDIRKPGSQAEAGSFLGFESAFKGTSQLGYPGGPFDPLNLAGESAEKMKDLQLKEIKNGEGFFVLFLACVLLFSFLVRSSESTSSFSRRAASSFPALSSAPRQPQNPTILSEMTHPPLLPLPSLNPYPKHTNPPHKPHPKQHTNQPPKNDTKQTQAASPCWRSSALSRSTPCTARAPGTTWPCT
jgi:hypothetical protein